MKFVIDFLLFAVCYLILIIALESGGMEDGSWSAAAILVIVPAHDKISRLIKGK